MPYLAMTASELRSCKKLPDKLAWMACHFSPYGTGLTNIPKSLPPGSLLILNDRTPVCGHDPVRVAELLQETVERLQCCGILLDLQRPGSTETDAIAEKILTLPCPVVISQHYARDRSCAVLLPPVPLLKTVAEHIAPWHGHEIWLELAANGEIWQITKDKPLCHPLAPQNDAPFLHFEEALACHYRMDLSPDKAQFTLKRTKDDLTVLLQEAKKAGVSHFVGLWQELGHEPAAPRK